MIYTPEEITALEPNEIFVFGSNLAGKHGAGAARTAVYKFGAIYGIGRGIQGNSYGIPTKDAYFNVLSLDRIREEIKIFLDFAHANPSKTFYVTKIGCGLSRYTPEDIAPLFHNPDCTIGSNIIFPKEFWDILEILIFKLDK